MEHAICEVFSYVHDNVDLKVEEKYNGCDGCYFNSQNKGCCKSRGMALFCGSFWRRDAKNVIFREV